MLSSQIKNCQQSSVSLQSSCLVSSILIQKKPLNNITRIKMDIQNLSQLSQHFLIKIVEENKMRIILQIIYSQHQKILMNKEKFYNSNIIECFAQNYQQLNQQSNYQNYYIFTCILDFDIFPLNPPYLFITHHPLYSRLNDFRNIVNEILGNTIWFPIFTLYDLFVKIPDYLKKLSSTNYYIKGSYYYQKSFKKSDIKQYANGTFQIQQKCLGLKIFDCEIYQTKDVLVGKYHQRTIGISFKSIIIFKRDNMNSLKFEQLYSINQLVDFEVEENEKRYKIILILQRKRIRIKFHKQKNNITANQNMKKNQFGKQHTFTNYLRLYQKESFYDKLNKQENSALQNKNSLKLKNEILSELIELTDLLNENHLHHQFYKQQKLFLQNTKAMNILCPLPQNQ